MRSKLFYALDERVRFVYLTQCTSKSKNPLKTIFNRTLRYLYLCYKTYRLVLKEKPNVILANDGWFVPYFKLKGSLYMSLWHLNAPKKPKIKLTLYDSLVILSIKELETWQNYHKNVRVISNFLPKIP